MQAGIPSVVVPFTADQTFWGETVHRLGIGPRSISYKKLIEEYLTRAIQEAISDDSIRQRASKLGERIGLEDGVSVVVESIEKECTTGI